MVELPWFYRSIIEIEVPSLDMQAGVKYCRYRVWWKWNRANCSVCTDFIDGCIYLHLNAGSALRPTAMGGITICPSPGQSVYVRTNRLEGKICSCFRLCGLLSHASCLDSYYSPRNLGGVGVSVLWLGTGMTWEHPGSSLTVLWGYLQYSIKIHHSWFDLIA